MIYLLVYSKIKSSLNVKIEAYKLHNCMNSSFTTECRVGRNTFECCDHHELSLLIIIIIIAIIIIIIFIIFILTIVIINTFSFSSSCPLSDLFYSSLSLSKYLSYYQFDNHYHHHFFMVLLLHSAYLFVMYWLLVFFCNKANIAMDVNGKQLNKKPLLCQHI